METWFSSEYLARVVTEERVRDVNREPVKLEHVRLDWLAKFLKNVTSLFM